MTSSTNKTAHHAEIVSMNQAKKSNQPAYEKPTTSLFLEKATPIQGGAAQIRESNSGVGYYQS